MARKKSNKPRKKKSSWLSVPLELAAVGRALVMYSAVSLPARVSKSLLLDPHIDSIFDEARFLDLLGDSTLELFDALGPIYGKMGQIGLSRLSPNMQKLASTLRLTRLYGEWPAMTFDQVAYILDMEIPHWRSKLRVEKHPLGVASMAQVHAATDADGREWVIKILKPHAVQRLEASLAALDKVIALGETLALSRVTKRALRELKELSTGFRREMSLNNERKNIDRIRELWREQDGKLLQIPDVLPEFSTDRVLTLQRFHGTPMRRLVDGTVEVDEALRKRLARGVLQELLIQIFELGLFHADPHAGNLILLDDGSVGLFDWGLAGELLDSDRKHIASMLKAVMARDIEKLITALQDIAKDSDQKTDRNKIRKELQSVVQLIKEGDAKGEKPSLQQILEVCLKSADRLRIPVPTGLLLMAKSLVTIEGLARGIDPKVSLAMVAGPVLWRAAQPGLSDVLGLAKQLPGIIKRGMFG